MGVRPWLAKLLAGNQGSKHRADPGWYALLVVARVLQT